MNEKTPANTESEGRLNAIVMPEPRFPIGTKFKKLGRKNQNVHTVVDYHLTFDRQGNVVAKRYVASSQFCGQEVFDNDVAETTVARGLVNHEL